MINRRQLFKTAGAATLAALLPDVAFGVPEEKVKSDFRFCLNTSTIKGQKTGLLKSIEIATRAGYDGIELWISDVTDHLNKGHSVNELSKFIRDNGIKVENAIGFATWLVDDEAKRKAGFNQMREQMELMAQLGCKRIAAPMIQILTDLKNMGGTKVLSLELFNEQYWKEDPMKVATTGLSKMKNLVSRI